MTRRDTTRLTLIPFALASLVLFATATATIAQSAEPPAKQQEAKADEAEAKQQDASKTDEKAGEKAAEAKAPAPNLGGDASVPRPRSRKPLPTKVDPKTGQKVFVLTNEGLVERFGEPREPLPSAAVPYGEQAPPAAGAAAAAAAEETGEQLSLDEARQRATEVRRDLRRLRNNLVRYRNPYLPRPDLSEEEQAEQSGRDNVERIAMTETRIAELEQELAGLEGQIRAADAEQP